MTSRGTSFFQRWIVNTLGVLVAANVVTGISYDGFVGLILASLLLGILNAFVRPVMIFFALPLLIFTLGLFILVINAVLLYVVGSILKSFHVDSFGSAFLGALIISFVSLIANWMLGTGEARMTFRRSPPRRNPRAPGDDTNRREPPPGNGPIIDV